MLELGTDPKTGGWGLQIRGDPRRNITEPNRTYEWYVTVPLNSSHNIQYIQSSVTGQVIKIPDII